MKITTGGDIIFYKDDGSTAGVMFDASSGNSSFKGATTTIGSGAASTNVELNLDGVASKAQRIQFREGATNRWLLGQGAASETSAFELYNATGTIALKFDRGTNVATFASGAVFNEDGLDQDFRVESDNNTHALFVDGGNSRVGINHSSPSYPLDVNGVIQSDEGMYVRGDVTSSNFMIDAYNTDGGEDTKIGVRTTPNTSGDAFTFYDTGGSNMVVGNHWKGTTNNQLRIGTGGDVGTGFGGGLYIDGNARTSVGTMLRVDNANYNGGSGGLSVSGTHDTVRSAYIPWIYGASTINRTYRHCFNITNGQAIEVYFDGGGGNTVWGTYGRIMVDHSYDYFIETNTLYYADLKIKIVTDGNANLSVWVAGNSYQDNLFQIRWRVRPIHTWDCTITNNPTSSQSAGYIEHLASGGMQRSGGGSMNGGSGPATTTF